MVGWSFFGFKPMTVASVLNFLNCLVELVLDRGRDLSSNILELGLALEGVVGVTGELVERREEEEGIFEAPGRDHHCCFAC